MNGKDDTFEFRPEEEHNKPQLTRSGYDEYSSARRNDEGLYSHEKNSGNTALIVVSIIMAIILVAVIVVGIILIKTKEEVPPEDEIVTEIEDDEEKTAEIPEEEDEAEEEPIIGVCSLMFYSDSIVSRNGEYIVKADLFDQDFYIFDTRELTIDDDTDIRESGKRISADALIYLIEEAGGDNIVFDAEIDDDKNRVISLSFESEDKVEKEEPEEEIIEEEDQEEIIPSEDEEVPSEDNEDVNQPVPEPQTPAEVPAENTPTEDTTQPSIQTETPTTVQ